MNPLLSGERARLTTQIGGNAIVQSSFFICLRRCLAEESGTVAMCIVAQRDVYVGLPEAVDIGLAAAGAAKRDKWYTLFHPHSKPEDILRALSVR